MNRFQFGLRKSSDSIDDNRSRYVPSSVYSAGGPGPIAEDSPAIGQRPNFMSGALRGPYEEQTPRFMTPSFPPQRASRNSTLLNINDPVAMHLLTETAISDSREYEVLSFEEVEQLKKEKVYLRGKVETTKRKLALESKLRDAAQSLNRLYTKRESNDSPESPQKKRRSFLGSKQPEPDPVARADIEFASSNKKVEDLNRELKELELQLEDIEKRILRHTAGILQMTHKGLKKNVRRTELPRSPESMTSQMNGRNSDDFDERSLYQVPDYVTDFAPPPPPKSQSAKRDEQPLDNVASRLQELNLRVHAMVNQAGSQEHFDPPPMSTDDAVAGRVGVQIQASLGYLSQALDAMEASRTRATAAVEKSLFDSEDQVEDVNLRLQDMLERTNSVGHSPLLPYDEPRGKDLQSQLAFSSVVLERLNSRVETLVEHKDILTRQIQQQRELNTKSDAERDEHIQTLTDELERSKKLNEIAEEEAKHSRDQMELLMGQLDAAQQENVLREQQRGVDDSKASSAELAASKAMEVKLLADLKAKQDDHSRVQAELAQVRSETETTSQKLLVELDELKKSKEQDEVEISALRQQITELQTAKDSADADLLKAQQETNSLATEVARVQTELTVARAELDGAYGSRAERAADVSMNPAIQKELDTLNSRNKELETQLEFLTSQHETKGAGSAELQNKVNALQQELKEMIEEYEVMTKQSIEDEKERERLEETVDSLQQRCETVEMHLNEEKLKWMGVNVEAPTETMSTMVLKNEFKKMMRETRAENLKTIRSEQEERRRLEGIIKSMKKEMQQRQARKAAALPNGSTESR
ncbi:hypothetical protein PV10_01565 [Exophiala mesophila]|uniref:Uncharacterized protein n=1 Tax=Exophiala mesophila TaxID=212818 RepID=A0A0D1ZTE7_EXOME|nr:uncharacterized protein PV10_01565 [Exophiala mesophila]KIV97862.1 hypothetical protein PV10_01565 [Exophiala mesophila]